MDALRLVVNENLLLLVLKHLHLLHVFYFQPFQAFELLVLHFQGLPDAQEQGLEVLLLGDFDQKAVLGHRLQGDVDVEHSLVILIAGADVDHHLVVLVKG